MSNLGGVVCTDIAARETSENLQCNDGRPATLRKTLRTYEHWFNLYRISGKSGSTYLLNINWILYGFEICDTGAMTSKEVWKYVWPF